MKKIIGKTILLFCLTLNSLFLTPFIPKVFAENIDSFHSEINIYLNGEIEVEETIHYNFGDAQKHGIYRNIPLIKEMNGKKYLLDVSNVSVNGFEGDNAEFTTTNKDNILQIKIGNPNKLTTGSRDYVIRYVVRGAIGYYKTFDELYWNVTGNTWEIPIGQATAIVNFRERNDVDDNTKYGIVCYTGQLGSKNVDCKTSYSKSSAFAITKDQLQPSEGMTVAFKFPKKIVATLLPIPYQSSEEQFLKFLDSPLGKLFIFIVGVLALFWYIIYPIKIFFNWWKNGRDSKSGQNRELAAWFDPPKFKKRFLTPEEAGTIIDEWADQKEISAMIIYLAQNGFLYIKEYEKEKFKLVKKASKKIANNYQKYFIDEIFKDSQELDLDTENISDICENVKKQIFESMTRDGLFAKNPNEIRNFYYVIIALSAFTLNFPLIVSAVIFGLNLVKRTDTGVELKFEALSLKNYMKSQDRQLEFQAKNQIYFEKLLPYAIAFGVEKVWIKRFEKMNFKNPDWYESNSTFTNYMFINNLHSSLSTSTMPDTSSGSSAGFSGGGGGGGGGGSW